jgi:isocitrate dehydrogenase (NAD+)
MTARIRAMLKARDEIGPEIVDVTHRVLEALAGTHRLGLAAWQVSQPPATRYPRPPVASIRRTRLVLEGTLETRSGGGKRSSNMRLREEFDPYANLRSVRTLGPGGR